MVVAGGWGAEVVVGVAVVGWPWSGRRGRIKQWGEVVVAMEVAGWLRRGLF